MENRMNTAAPDPTNPQACVCLGVRRAARVVTRAYEEALKPGDLKATQFSLLAYLVVSPTASFAEITTHMAMDQSTLTRNLRPLERRGLIAVRPGPDRRTRTITLTAKGRRLYEEVLPMWLKVQSRVVERLGRSGWGDLRTAFDRLVGEVQE
jgi:DNA-binding MarR family transcriptional regulator